MDQGELQLVADRRAVLRTAAATAGAACAVGAVAVTVMLGTRGSLEAVAAVNELWWTALLLMWTAGAGLSAAPWCGRRRPLGRTCAGLSIAGLAVSGLPLLVGPWYVLIILIKGVDAVL